MSDENDEKDSRKNNKKYDIKPLIIIAILALIFTIIINNYVNKISKGEVKEIKYSEFIEMVENDEVESVSISSDKITIVPKNQTNPLTINTYYTVKVADYNLIDRLEAAGIEFDGITESSGIAGAIIYYVIAFVIFYAIIFFIVKAISKGGGIMGNVGKSTAKVYIEKKTGVTFDDVAGEEEAKESLTEMVDFLHNPQKYLKIGAKLPKGALLVGPPGTGKTLLAKAVAGEADVPFFSLSGSDFVEMFVGVGASRVRDLFKQAQSMAPCIIFIDEIDAIGKSRDSQYGGGNDEREQTLNQLLAEMDGFDTSKGVVILAATNRPEVLDKALLRPGRFDRRVIVEKPDLKGRVDTLKVHSKNVLMDDSVDFQKLALATAGAVGSDLANIINEAALLAVKEGREVVTQKDLLDSVEMVFGGKEKKNRILSDKEKKIVAYHEIGHALVSALLKNTEPVQKITIVPRTMGTLGYVLNVPEEEKNLEFKEELDDMIVTFLAGRAAEKLKFNTISTGASNDIEKATSIARSMVTMYGMSDELGMVGLESIENRYLDGRAVLQCSEQTSYLIDLEVKNKIKSFYEKAENIIKENMTALDKLAEYLIEKENITGAEFMQIFEEATGKKLKSAIKEDEDKASEISLEDKTEC